MPELPEVQRTRRFLQNFLIKPILKKILNVKVFKSDIIKNVDAQTFIKTLNGQKFTQIDRYGKYLFLKLQTHTIISHLRLQGRYRFRQQYSQPKKHQHVHFQMTDGTLMAYHDQIRLGSMHLVNKGEQMQQKILQKMGPQVNTPEFTTDYFYQKCKKSRTAIKKMLLNQSVVSGIGNKWADQILHKVKVHPETQARKLTHFQVQDIVIESKSIINRAVSTSRRLTRINAYNKTGKTCKQCKVSKIEKIKVGQRGAHFCPTCQVKKQS